eukprot:TRINITY_DN245_c0_g1_i1.p1 TRINITY_DN245_c0_g1~~TRINITY_DN245_c0_g1_i1.p1  ORF type:complete len:242 (+),score=89.71 TRINITY_DN245_c0_g1_i1:55-726(+)
MSKPTLMYFPLRARADNLRALLHVAGVEFEDKHVTFEEWPALKAQQPFGQLPVLKDGDVTIGQSNAIARYLARKHKLYGANDAEQVQIDQVVEHTRDMLDAVVKLIWGNESFEADAKAFIADKLPGLLAPFSKWIAANGGSGFLIGSSLSYADIEAWHVLNNFVAPFKHVNDGADVFPADVAAYLDRVRAVPAIASFAASSQAKVTMPALPAVKFLNNESQFA